MLTLERLIRTEQQMTYNVLMKEIEFLKEKEPDSNGEQKFEKNMALMA